MDGTSQNQSSIASEITFFGCNIFLPNELEEIQKAGIEDLRFCKLIEWMCNEISVLYGLDEIVHAPTGPDNMEFFFLELSALLSELECPVNALTRGPVAERFRSTENQIKLLNFLMGHMKCSRLTALNRLQEEAPEYKSNEVLQLESVFVAVGMDQLPSGTENIFSALKDVVEKQMHKCKEKPRPLLTASLNNTEWEKIKALNEKLTQEYRIRILLLLKRLDVTIQSFIWSDRIKKVQDKLHEIYRPRREQIAVTLNVGMDDLLSATSSLLTVDRINSEKERKRTASRLNKILMTDRPGDRGGRPSELRAPPPEMPPWIKERVSDQGGWQRSDYKSGGGRGYQRDSTGYQESGSFQDAYGRGSYYSGGGGFKSSGRGAGFESQVMREYEGYHNQSHSGRQSGGRRGQGGYGGQRGYR
uniref:Protein FAM98A n=1 Tax=Elaeophora elaphi TaxID=1147741 RepID=A0A0R3RS79_9BILA